MFYCPLSLSLSLFIPLPLSLPPSLSLYLTHSHPYHHIALSSHTHRNLEGLCRTAYLHLQKVAKERDNQYESGVEITLERDYFKQLHESVNPNESLPLQNGLPVGSPSPAKSPAVNAELLELKKRCRHLQEQL